MNLLSVLLLIIGSILVLVLLYFASGPLTSFFTFIGNLLRVVSLAPKWLQVLGFILIFFGIGSLLTSILFSGGAVCVDQKAWDAGYFANLAAKGLPETSFVDGNVSAGFMSKMARWFVDERHTTSEFGTLLTVASDANVRPYSSQLAGLGSSVIAFVPQGNPGSLPPTLENGDSQSYDYWLCVDYSMDNKNNPVADRCYVSQYASCDSSAANTVARIAQYEYTFDRNDDGSYAVVVSDYGENISVKKVVGLTNVYWTLGDCKVSAEYSAETGKMESAQYITIDESELSSSQKGWVFGSYAVLQDVSYTDQSNVRAAFLNNLEGGIEPVSSNGFIGYKCDADDNAVPLFLGVDLFNFQTLMVLMVLAGLLWLTSALKLL